MAATVPESRITAVQSGVEIGRSVRAITWIDAARLQCWLAGRGSMDVPCHSPAVTISASGSSTFRYWTKPRYQTTRYAYSFVLRGASRGTATVTIASGGTAHSCPIGTRDDPRPHTIFVDRASQSTTEAELSFDITAPSGIDVTVESVSIEAVPRLVLSVSGSDLGADRLRHLARQPILDAYLATEVLDRMNDLRDACRRVGMFQFSRGTGDPWTSTGAAAAMFSDGIALTGRYLYSADTLRTVRCVVLAMCSDGTTAGAVNVSTVNGDSLAIAIPTGTTSWTWLPATTSNGAIDCRAEDNTATDGFRTAADEFDFTIERTAGAGTVSVATVSIFDAAD